MPPGFSIPYQQILTVIFAASSMTTAIFWGAYLLGKLVGRIDTMDVRVRENEEAIRALKGYGG